MNDHEQAIREQLEYTEPEAVEDTFPELADGLCDVYMNDLLYWLVNEYDTVRFVDDAISDRLAPDLEGLLRTAQYYWHYERLVEEWERIKDTLEEEAEEE